MFDRKGLAAAGVRSPRDPRQSWSWLLFADWCASWGFDPMPASEGTLTGFLEAFPGARSTQVARLAVILRVHDDAGLVVKAPRLTGLPDTVWAPRPGLLDPEGALMQVPRYRFPTGLVGRRDGFLIVLTGTLGLTRGQARQVAPTDIGIDPGSGVITVCGVEVPVGEDPRGCPRCAVAFWLATIAPHYERLRGSYLPLLDPTAANPAVHACQGDVGVLWRKGVSLLPSIDRTGAVSTGAALSTRAITTIIGMRRVPTGTIERTGQALVPAGRYRNASSGELAAAQDDVLDQVDRANNYLEELLAEAALMKDTLDPGWSPA